MYIRPFIYRNTGDEPSIADQIEAGFKRLLEKKGGDVDAAARLLYHDNFQTREDNRKLKEQLEELKGKQPAEGSVVLTAEEAKVWESIKMAHPTPSEVPTLIASHKALSVEMATIKRKQEIQKIASHNKLNPEVLGSLLEGKEVRVQEIVATVDGKEIKTLQAFVKDGDVERELDAIRKEKWSAFEPALVAVPEGGSAGGGSGQNDGVVVVGSSSGGGGGGGSAVDLKKFFEDKQKAMEKETNPLRG